MMMQRAADTRYFIDEEKTIKGKDGNSEIDMIEKAGILVTVKATAQGVRQSKANIGLASESSVVRNTQMNPNPWDTRSRIIRLTHAVTAYDIECDEEFEYSRDDLIVAGQCYGDLVKVVIPRPNPDHDHTPGVGKVFVEYADLDGASRFKSSMNGRPYEGNHVVAVYYPEDMYAQGILDLDLDA